MNEVTLAPLRRTLLIRVKVMISLGLLLGILAMAVSPAGGPSAGLLDLALLALALWLSRGPSPEPDGRSRGGAMTGNQALLLVLALGGAAVLVAAGAASRPLHGLAVAPFAMAAFALSSHNSRDLRSGALAALASVLVVSVADDRGFVVALCGLGLVPLVFGWVAVRQLMTLDRCPETGQLTAVPRNRPWSSAVVARLVLVTAVAALLLPAEPAPHSHRGDGSDPGNQQPDPGERGYAIGASSALDLRERGGLDGSPMISVPATSPTLWQASYFDTYNGSYWKAAGADHYVAPVVIQLPLGEPTPTGQDLATGTVQPLSKFFLPQVFSPGPVVSVDAEGGKLFLSSYGPLAISNRNNDSQPYQVTWRDPEDGAAAPTLARGVPPVDDPHWLQLPTELPQRVKALAATVTAAAATREDKVAAIESYLRSNEKYQLDSPVPAVGTDAVDAFLFTDHVGFCEQFASAETVMLRSLGIPARVAGGYGGSGAPSADGTTRTYRNQDAHAWVQVGYPGDRWLNSDPTAGSQLATPSVRHRLSTWLKKVWKQLTGSPKARRVLAALLLATSMLLWFVTRALLRWRRGRRRLPNAVTELETPAGKAYQRLLERLRAQDRAHLPTETVRDLLARLGAPEQEAVASVLETEWYGRGEVSAERSALAAGLLDGLALQAVEVMAGAAP